MYVPGDLPEFPWTVHIKTWMEEWIQTERANPKPDSDKPPPSATTWFCLYIVISMMFPDLVKVCEREGGPGREGGREGGKERDSP